MRGRTPYFDPQYRKMVILGHQKDKIFLLMGASAPPSGPLGPQQACPQNMLPEDVSEIVPKSVEPRLFAILALFGQKMHTFFAL